MRMLGLWSAMAAAALTFLLIFASVLADPPWGANVRVNDDTGDASRQHPVIAIDRQGSNAYAVWADFRDRQNIYSSKLPAGSSTWGPNIRVNDVPGYDYGHPDIAVDAKGDVYAVWQGHLAQPGNPAVFFSRLPGGSSAWSPSTRISVGSYAVVPSISVDAGRQRHRRLGGFQ